MRTPQQKNHYVQEGYLVLEDFKSPSEMAAIRERAGAIVDAFDPATRSIFTTQYFHDAGSGDGDGSVLFGFSGSGVLLF